MRFSPHEWRVIQAIFSAGEATRADIVRATGLSKALVVDTLTALSDRETIDTATKTQKGGGRPRFVYSLTGDLGYAIGISVETDAIQVVAVDARQQVIADARYPLVLSADVAANVEQVRDQITTGIEKTVAAADLGQNELLEIAMALPGMVDAERGIWISGVRISGITHANIRDYFVERFARPVLIEDSSRALTFLEQTSGAGRGVKDFVLLYLGSGTGSGIVFDHHIREGFHGMAGEIGHVAVDANGYRCACGMIGCFETVVSVNGILRRFEERLREGVDSLLQRVHSARDGELTIGAILQAARDGDRFTRATLFEIGEFIGEVCTIVVKLFNPQKLIIGGSVSVLGEFFRDAIKRIVDHGVISEMLTDFEITFAQYHQRNDAVGVALLGFHDYLQRMNRSTGDGIDGAVVSGRPPGRRRHGATEAPVAGARVTSMERAAMKEGRATMEERL